LTAEGKVLAYTTDNEPFGEHVGSHHLVAPSRHVELAHHADVLIQDAQYTPAEYAPYRIGWGHSTYLDALQVARQTEAKRLILFHHDPSHSDAQIDRIVRLCRTWIKEKGLRLECFGAVEGPGFVV
jgi:ribonuclease BN (tRNA processing enzyme)